MSRSFHFGELQHFTAGTVGPSGQRVFYLQFGNPDDLATLQLEKIQVRALAEFLDQLLDEAEPILQDEIPLALELIEPISPDWIVSSLGVAFEKDKAEFVVVAEERSEDSDAAMAQIHLTPGQVKAFIARANDLIRAGRPPCEICGDPINYADGWCPCSN
ncbi:MAG: hypothetical protein CL455_08805 [Acidimicrobiaceae bacterium]|nr:hypothetical protein [Acidimicrobiaceae bacterium]|tara:strand:- start:560 stop:1039 length:480 start_codon:yes stop_codon:yes gene_type:complete